MRIPLFWSPKISFERPIFDLYEQVLLYLGTVDLKLFLACARQLKHRYLQTRMRHFRILGLSDVEREMMPILHICILKEILF